MNRRRIYLDNAATSWPKPASVYDAVELFQRRLGAAAGRGAYRSAQQSGRLVERTRAAIRRLLHAPRQSEIVFTFNGTDGLNLCLFGTLRPKDHVITSVAEHNSILRPLRFLSESIDVNVTYLPCATDGTICPSDVEAAITVDTRLIALTHASNVTSAIQPIEEISQIARGRGVRLLVDAAQTAGHVPMDLTKTPIDMLVASGHKGLMGPLGTGLVVFAEGIGQRTTPIRFGGTGTRSESEVQPDTGVSRFESGNLNIPGLAGLGAAVEYLFEHPELHSRHRALGEQVLTRLHSIDRVRVIGPRDVGRRVGLVSFAVDGMDCHDVAGILDSSANVEVRAGLHCAPRMHKTLGLDGTVRASWGAFTTSEELDIFCDALSAIGNSL